MLYVVLCSDEVANFFIFFNVQFCFLQISLCEDYSLPVDHLNKKRPNSIAVPISSEWNVSSPSEENVSNLYFVQFYYLCNTLN